MEIHIFYYKLKFSIMAKISEYPTDKLIEEYKKNQRTFWEWAKLDDEIKEDKKRRTYYPFPSLHLANGISQVMIGGKIMLLLQREKKLKNELVKRDVDVIKLYEKVKREFYPNS